MNKSLILLAVVLFILRAGVKCQEKKTNVWSRINLRRDHMPYFFGSNEKWRRRCLKDSQCPFKEEAAENATKCWGYERYCQIKNRLFLVECPDDSYGWGDFGYIQKKLSEMKFYCQPEEPGDSSLECVDHLQMCRAKNIYIDFADLNIQNSVDKYREDTFKRGQIGGKCKFDSVQFSKQNGHKSPLQSWYSELQLYESMAQRPIEAGLCDLVVSEPTFLIKLDAGVNMYHHFCDFINLYVTQHANNSFFQNVNIVVYDTSYQDYWSFFDDMWKVFSNKPIIHLKKYDKKKVCFRDAVFSFLARMRFGLYYNMPLINGCHSTGLFKTFSEHVLHRLKISQDGPLERKLRVTLLARGTKYRNVLNQKELIKELKRELKNEIELSIVTYDMSMKFSDQLKKTHNTDVFMSMHGAGLTHLLFLPDWAAVFEIYNCEDAECYYDLARLRGVKYFTWEKADLVYPQDEGKHPQLGTPHKKFTNYSFEPSEFVRLVKKMLAYVKTHPAYLKALKEKFHNASKIEL